MSKKKGKVVQMLSPENYIRQKARTLPISECWVNADWKESGLANIFVARKHSNGNITSGLYLVDLKCLGVKDAHYWFNIQESEYQYILESANEAMALEPVSYMLAHNIVFAGIGFAGEYGFKPHKDYTSVAQYILEEDTDDVEMMEIECGYNGKPMYVRGPNDSDTFANRILAQLEKTAGKGNYDFIYNLDGEDFDEEEDEFFDEENWDEEFQEILKTKSPGLQFKIQLVGVDDPQVWRRVIVPSHYNFMFFHGIIQDVFGWEDCHLYSFSPKGWGSYPAIQEDEEDEEGETLNPSDTRLSDIFNTKGQKFTYIYDFGDNWEHQIILEKILQEEISRPSCIDGKGKCPPEDCGSIPGYENLKAVLADPADPEHDEMKDWLGLDDDETWDPDEFDLKEVQEMLASQYSLNKKTDEN